MKKSHQYILGAALLVSVSINFYACNQEPKLKEPIPEKEETKTTSTAINAETIGIDDFLMHSDTAAKYINQYIADRVSQDPTLTKSIYYPREVIEWLGEEMKNAPAGAGGIDGIRIFMLQYPPEMNERLGRNGTKQTGLVIVPTRDRKADWTYWNSLKDNLKKTSSLSAPLKGLNHGELCPSRCN